MFLGKLAYGLLVIVIIVTLSVPASATVIIGSFSGTVSNGVIDTYGDFGAVGGSLAGKSLSGVIVYDTSLMTYSQQAGVDSLQSTGVTGAESVSITIGSNTLTVRSSGFGGISDQSTSSGYQQITSSLYDGLYYVNFSLASISSWTAGQIDGSNTFDAILSSLSMAANAQSVLIATDGNNYEDINFRATSATSVPEPSSIKLMLIGLLGLFLGRYSNRQRA
jgi:hypothetical protein